jgi:hypothetical protein
MRWLHWKREVKHKMSAVFLTFGVSVKTCSGAGLFLAIKSRSMIT